MAIGDRETHQAIEELVKVEMRPAWDFRIEIDDRDWPKEMDVLAKDLSYDPVTLSLEQSDIGARQISDIVGQEHVSMTATLRDTRDKKVYNWCVAMAGKAVHADGTIGLPGEYVRKVSVYYIAGDPDEEPEQFGMFVSEVAGINPDRSSAEFFEFTVTFTEHRTGAIVEKVG